MKMKLSRNKRQINDIICYDCNQVIKSSNNLAIAGRTLIPFHKTCFFNPQKKLSKLFRFIGRFPLRGGFVLALILINGFISYMYHHEIEGKHNLVGFWWLINLIYIGARILIYTSYEKPIRDKYGS